MHPLNRKQKLTADIDLSTKRGLEIGPLCWPLIQRDEAKDIKYVDHVDTQTLKKIYKKDKGVDLNAIVDVDYPLNNRSLKQTVGKSKFDYIIASHVIEHVPDVVSWLKDLSSVLKDGGILALAIPDKRYTFDIDREPSSTGSILGQYIEKSSHPSSQDLLDYLLSFRENIDAKEVWDGDLYLNSRSPHRHSLHDALAIADKTYKSKAYYDSHISVFTPTSFFNVISDLIELDLFSYKVRNFYDTEYGAYEFIVVFEKLGKSDINIQKRSLPPIDATPTRRELEKSLIQLQEENTKLRNELFALGRSFSWRITKPLRHVRKFGRKLRSKVRRNT